MRFVTILFLFLMTGCARSTCDSGSCSQEPSRVSQGGPAATPSTSVPIEQPAEGSEVPSTGGNGTALPPSTDPPSTDPPPAPIADPSEFVRASGHDMLDPDDNTLLLKTMNLGNWLLVEGYMWHFFPDNGIGVRHRVVEQKVRELLGDQAAAQFWTDYRANYITSDDMNAIKAMGFNSVRLPLNARFLLPENSSEYSEAGFADVQRAVDLARGAGLYVILDMHAAPGGQAGKDIDDSPDYCAELFLNPSNQDRLVALWREIARRFANEAVVAGFDLLNEPIPWRDQLWEKCRPSESDYWENFILALYPLYQRIGAAIREVDPNHMLIVQGAYWGSDVQDSLGAPFDENMAYSFHYYHTPATEAGVQKYVDARAAANRPIWVGEFGEDTNDHYRNLITLFESKNFGWSFWTWKRINAGNTPYSIDYPDDWHIVEEYVVDNRSPPGDWDAQATFNSFLQRMRFSNNSSNGETVGVLSQ